jgi:hypothetical protein
LEAALENVFYMSLFAGIPSDLRRRRQGLLPEHLVGKRKGKERKGKERKGKERKGKERKGKERHEGNWCSDMNE